MANEMLIGRAPGGLSTEPYAEAAGGGLGLDVLLIDSLYNSGSALYKVMCIACNPDEPTIEFREEEISSLAGAVAGIGAAVLWQARSRINRETLETMRRQCVSVANIGLTVGRIAVDQLMPK